MKWEPPNRPTFPAKFASTLDGCGCDVDEGDEIGYDDNDELNCEEHLNG